ncbi:MAG: MarR family transcriptional regulator [Ruminococcus sp.]|nr:MarR family transcriptional regulator [Ruminococcus sp.]
MNEKTRADCVSAMYELFPRGRKLIYEAFDRLGGELTRTQQMILLALTVEDNLSMSKLADRICTSNEQATRAVAKLVDNGYLVRKQNPLNRRVVNITLTDKAKDYIADSKKSVLAATVERAGGLSAEDMETVRQSIETVLNILDKISGLA